MVKFWDRVKLARSRCCYMCKRYNPSSRKCVVPYAMTSEHKTIPGGVCREIWGWDVQFKLNIGLLLTGMHTLDRLIIKEDKRNARSDRIKKKDMRRISLINLSDMED